jgi:hypothetical protein
VDFVTGSTRFGSISENTHQFTGSVSVSGSTNLAGSLTVNKVAINSGNLNLASFPSLDLIVSGGIGFSSGGSGAAALVDRDGSGNTTFYGGSGDIKFTDVTMTSNYLTIKSAGNVGIGIASPNEKLQVEGAISATGTASTAFASSSTLDWYSTGTRIISRGANTSTRGTFILKLESSNSSLSSDVLQFSNLGAATFSSSVSLGGYLTGQGVNPGGLGGSRYVIDWLSGYMRIFSYGANTSTNGGFVLNSQRSDGTNSLDYLSISAAGLATFSSNGGNLAIFKTNNTTDSYNSAVILAGNANATQASRSAYILLDPNGANGTGQDYEFFTALGTGETQFGTSKSDGFLALYTADTKQMHITSAGNVGVGRTPAWKLDVNGIINAEGTGNYLGITNIYYIGRFVGTSSGCVIAYNDTNARGYLSSSGTNSSLGFITNSSGTNYERLTIANDGKVTITAPAHNQLTVQDSDAKIEFGADDGTMIGIGMVTAGDGITWFTGRHRPGSAGIYDEMNVARLSGTWVNLFRIYSNGNWDFAGSDVSDIRLKENIKTINYNATEKLLQLVPKSYNMIEHPTISKSGFIAQDVKEILPSFVTGNESENEYLGVDYNGILALAVKAIQELNTKLDAANVEIEALKSR